MSYRIALVCEGNTDMPVIRTLANRLIANSVDWMADQMGDAVSWSGYEPGTEHLPWSHVKRFALSKLEPIGRKEFGAGTPASNEAYTARKALLLFDGLPTEARPDVVILQRDEDRVENRRKDLNLARESSRWAFAVVVGVARPMIESWILAGFIPTDKEGDQHQATCNYLGFDPCRFGEKLSPKHDDLTKRPKQVLDTLTRSDSTQVRSCYEDTPLAHLQQSGASNGLTDFLNEVRSLLIPALGGPHPNHS